MSIKKYLSIITFFMAAVGLVICGQTVRAEGFTTDHKYAYSENAGWLNASTTYEKLTVSAKGITGYLWAENIGWIKFDYDGVAGATNTTATDWGVTNDGEGNLGGYAWGENIGWINFGHELTDYVMTYTGKPWATTNDLTVGTAEINGYAAKLGYDISERGFTYGTSIPATATSSDSGTFSSGAYSETLTLYCDTTYYVRAFAINSEGLSYGDYVAINISAASGNHPGMTIEGGVTLEGDFTFEMPTGGESICTPP